MNRNYLPKKNTLHYIHDPMCSWCYAFKNTLLQLCQELPEGVEFSPLLGGLATDTEASMPAQMRQQIQATWELIEQKVPGVQFNFDFWNNWQKTRPRRATYPACRAVIAAHHFDNNEDDSYEISMINAIQTAYYRKALNPSDDKVLIQLANEIGLEQSLFQSELKAHKTYETLKEQMNQSRKMNVHSYPSLVLQIEQNFWPIDIDYLSATPILKKINTLLKFE
ncbi:MAG: DsbA family protein [Gammaproteobacteria bacterium]|nr:DsbA family protein [Gammaproteobacteria bacterium]